MEKNEHILLTKGLSKYFGGLHALEQIDVTVEKGQIHGLIGPNGSGKTTFFNIITGLLPPTKGEINFDSTNITNLKPHVISRMGISRTFQAGKIAPGMTVLENVMSGAHTHVISDVRGTFFHLPFTSSRLEERRKRQPGEKDRDRV